jgi:toxin FitB
VIVLDTNVISEVMRPVPYAQVMTWLRGQPLQELTITAVSVAEISYGLRLLPQGRRRSDLGARFRTFLAHGFSDRILAFDAEAADLYGEIVTIRRAAGHPIEAFDAMIAAIARSRAASIATRNVVDFEGCGVPLRDPWRA